MAYNPSIETARLLAQALQYVRAAPYQVTARWVFYRLLQDALLSMKSDYKRLLSYLSKARKGFYDGWTPDILADDSRGAILMERTGYYGLHFRGFGFESPEAWTARIQNELNYQSDRWVDQVSYVEVWFEAAAMQSQFLYYVNENVPLLAFHGDISIPEKWKAAHRIVDRWLKLEAPTKIFYFGDLDAKGLQIPRAAETDVLKFAAHYWWREQRRGMSRDEFREAYGAFRESFEFIRVGLNDEAIASDLILRNDLDSDLLQPHLGQTQVGDHNIPENPERPGTYQWEGLDDTAAQELIGQVTDHLNLAAFGAVEDRERDITEQFRAYLGGLELDADEDADQEE